LISQPILIAEIIAHAVRPWADLWQFHASEVVLTSNVLVALIIFCA